MKRNGIFPRILRLFFLLRFQAALLIAGPIADGQKGPLFHAPLQHLLKGFRILPNTPPVADAESQKELHVRASAVQRRVLPAGTEDFPIPHG